MIDSLLILSNRLRRGGGGGGMGGCGDRVVVMVVDSIGRFVGDKKGRETISRPPCVR